MQLIEQPDVLIVEGINVLQVGQGDGRKRRKVFVSDFFDFSIYVDAEESNIRRWYIERFLKPKETASEPQLILLTATPPSPTTKHASLPIRYGKR